MDRLEELIEAWRAANCPVGGDSDATRWWDRWIEGFWRAEPARMIGGCEPRLSHHGRIRWHAMEDGLLGISASDRSGHYWIAHSERVSTMLFDDAWFACCEEVRPPLLPAVHVFTEIDRLKFVVPMRLPVGNPIPQLSAISLRIDQPQSASDAA